MAKYNNCSYWAEVPQWHALHWPVAGDCSLFDTDTVEPVEAKVHPLQAIDRLFLGRADCSQTISRVKIEPHKIMPDSIDH